MIRWLLLGAVALGVVGLIYVRTVSHDPRQWHGDPLAPSRTGKPNDFLMLPPGMAGADAESPVFDLSKREAMRRLDLIARGERGVTRIAGDVEAAFITYVARSRWVGWPDVVSVKVVPASDDRVALAIWSRARFGHSDLGVNEARVRRWAAALEAQARR
ncbi:MAG: DUF1499 domain-containing protein [Rhodobacteraceae bacterium]|nr:MAG: DUF1499 domain-containing protein [Paracoccaceae bacterium]